MSHFKKVVLYSSILIIVFDTVGSFASEFFDFAYSSLSAGSYLIFGTAGFFAGKERKLGKSALAGFLVGLIESTIGWAISWQIGPGQPAPEISTNTMIISAIIFVSLTGTLFGFIGGLIKKYVGKDAGQAASNTSNAG